MCRHNEANLNKKNEEIAALTRLVGELKGQQAAFQQDARDSHGTDSILQEALQQVAQLQTEKEHLTQACNAVYLENDSLVKERQTILEEVEMHSKSSSHKEELLEVIETIAKNENGLLRGIIEQLKEEISQRIELHSEQAKGLGKALDDAHVRYAEDLNCHPGAFNLREVEAEITQFEDELRKESNQENWYVSEDPNEQLEQAITKVLSSIACPVKMELTKTGTPGEYIADRKIKLILRNGQVLVRQGTGYDSLVNYMEALHEPFIYNLEFGVTREDVDTAGRSLSRSPPRSGGTGLLPLSPGSPLLSDHAEKKTAMTPQRLMPVEALTHRAEQNLKTQEFATLKSEERPKRLKERSGVPSGVNLDNGAHPTLLPFEAVLTPPQSHVRGDFDARNEQQDESLVRSLSKSPVSNLWASPSSISPVSSSASELQHDMQENADDSFAAAEAACRFGLDPDSTEDMGDQIFSMMQYEEALHQHVTKENHHEKPSMPRVALHESHDNNKVTPGTDAEDEVRVRALKKFALRKQFEEQRRMNKFGKR